MCCLVAERVGGGPPPVKLAIVNVRTNFKVLSSGMRTREGREGGGAGMKMRVQLFTVCLCGGCVFVRGYVNPRAGR